VGVEPRRVAHRRNLVRRHAAGHHEFAERGAVVRRRRLGDGQHHPPGEAELAQRRHRRGTGRAAAHHQHGARVDSLGAGGRRDRIGPDHHRAILDPHRIPGQRIERRRLQHRAVVEVEHRFVPRTDQPAVADRALVKRRLGVRALGGVGPYLAAVQQHDLGDAHLDPPGSALRHVGQHRHELQFERSSGPAQSTPPPRFLGCRPPTGECRHGGPARYVRRE